MFREHVFLVLRPELHSTQTNLQILRVCFEDAAVVRHEAGADAAGSDVDADETVI